MRKQEKGKFIVCSILTTGKGKNCKLNCVYTFGDFKAFVCTFPRCQMSLHKKKFFFLSIAMCSRIIPNRKETSDPRNWEKSQTEDTMELTSTDLQRK